MTDGIRHKFLDEGSSKGIIFDFFGVISSEIHPVWLSRCKKEFNLSESEIKEMSDKIDLGDINEKQYQEFYGNKVGLTQLQVEEEMQSLVVINKKVVSLIRGLRENNYPIHLLSNAHHTFLKPLLKSNNLSSLFDSITISSEVGIKNPARKYMKLFFRNLG